MRMVAALFCVLPAVAGCGREAGSPIDSPSAEASAVQPPAAGPAPLPAASAEPARPRERTAESTDPTLAEEVPVPTSPKPGEAVAIFAGGCFWCVEAVFERLDGVLDARSGYSGGEHDEPTYESVCSGTTGHAEAVRVRFDPKKISYENLVEVFFHTHDPTTKDRQGNDIGTQYRSAIFTHDDEQREIALRVKKRLDEAGTFGRPIATEIVALERFWDAEEKHQDYFARNPNQPYCAVTIPPKLRKLEKAFADRLRK